MNKRLQQRLIGAAVIIALAVIFVPMLLSNSGGKKTISVNMKIPQEPNYTFNGASQPPAGSSTAVETLKVISPPSPSPTRKTSAAIPPPGVDNATAPGAKPPAISSGAATAKVVEPKVIAPPQTHKPQATKAPSIPVQTKSALPAKPLPTAPAAPARQTPPNPGKLHGWSVQVAAFYKESRARALQSRLERMGYKAYVTRFDDKARKKTFYQVRVGPESSSGAAKKLLSRIYGTVGLKGYLVHYP